jgi:hypothetical protein
VLRRHLLTHGGQRWSADDRRQGPDVSWTGLRVNGGDRATMLRFSSAHHGDGHHRTSGRHGDALAGGDDCR